MISGLQKILLTLLVLLQFIAPLVHAHTDNNLKLHSHIENLLANNNDPHLIQSTYHLSNNQHAIISIDSGIQYKKIAVNNHYLFSYLSRFIITDQINFSPKINFPPQSDIPTTSLIFEPQSPRAPPYI
jgi:hypothetical protein